MKYTSNLFESIKEALNKKTTSESGFRDFMKLEIGNTYLVRLIPNLQAPERTVYHYYHHLWKSALTNQLVSVLCPTTYGERCPIDEYRSKIYRTNNEAEIKRIQPIRRNENWLANVYVVKDPTTPENQGQVKILRMGKQLNKIVTDAISGDDSEEFGARIFDLSDKGCNLRIKVEQNEGGYPTYVSSKFVSPSPLEGATDLEAVYNSFKQMDTIFEHKSTEDINKLLKEHFLGEEPTPVTSKADTEEEEEYITPPVSILENKQEVTESNVDDRIQDLLKDL
jgi:gp32 DNA binding protein like